MAFDYKKEYKEFYMPTPSIVTVPAMNYIAYSLEHSALNLSEKAEYTLMGYSAFSRI